MTDEKRQAVRRSGERRIYRARHTSEQPYFLMNRETAQDRELSFEARGMLAYLLSKPDDWGVRIEDLQQQCGRDKVYRILTELLKAGYLSRKRDPTSWGKSNRWEYFAFETSYKADKPKEPCPEKPDTVGSEPNTEKPDAVTPEPCPEKPDDTYKRVLQNTDLSSAIAEDSREPITFKLTEVWKDETTGEIKAQTALGKVTDPPTPVPAPPAPITPDLDSDYEWANRYAVNHIRQRDCLTTLCGLKEQLAYGRVNGFEECRPCRDQLNARQNLSAPAVPSAPTDTLKAWREVETGNAMGNIPIPAGYETWKNCRGVNQLYMHLAVEGRERPTYLCKTGARQARKVIGDGRSIHVLCPDCQRIAAARTAPKPTPPTPRPRDAVFDALALLCYGTADISGMKSVGSSIGKTAREIKQAEPTVTPERVTAFGAWWNRCDFRGQKGQRPEPYQVPGAWLKFMNGECEPTGVKPNGRRNLADEAAARRSPDFDWGYQRPVRPLQRSGLDVCSAAAPPVSPGNGSGDPGDTVSSPGDRADGSTGLPAGPCIRPGEPGRS